MIVERDHPSLIPPNEDDVIWRYINLEKFESLLNERSLFFCRANRFSDPFEGSVPKREADYRIEDLKRVCKFYGEDFNLDEAKKNDEAFSKMHKKIKGNTVINCWHINEFESDGMWQLYLKSNEGVSIKSSIKRIILALEKTPENLYMSKVRYIDYEEDLWNHPVDFPDMHYSFLTPFVHKRIEYKHETELRLFYEIPDVKDDDLFWTRQDFEKGIMISVDLDILIEEIVLPPTADDHIENKIKAILNEYGLEKRIRKSKLSADPFY